MDAAVCSFYGFQNPPFGPAARAAPFFRTDARNALIRGIADEVLGGRTIIGLRGDHGSGKSVLMADIGAALRARGCLVVAMDRSAHGPKPLLAAIAHARRFAADTPVGAPERLVLLFDDAEAIPADLFRMLWQLVQLCGPMADRLHLVLVGGTGLWAGLNAPDLAALRKAAISETLIPYLQENEAADYLDRKLQHAGQPLSRLMTKRAIADLVARAHGLPARLDTLAERALAFGYEHGRRRITSRRMRQALAETPAAERVSPFVAPWASGVRATSWALGALALACLAGVGVTVMRQDRAGDAPAPAAANTAALLAPAAVPAPVSKPAPAPRAAGLSPVAPPAASAPVPGGNSRPTQNAAPARGLVLLAGPGDTLRSLFDRVYRGTDAPDFDLVRADNPGAVTPGTMVVFPAPAGGWPAP